MKQFKWNHVYLTLFIIFLLISIVLFIFQSYSSNYYKTQIKISEAYEDTIKQNLKDYSELSYGRVEITGPTKNGIYLLYPVKKDGACFDKYSQYNSLTVDSYCKKMFGSAFMGGRGISSQDVKFINEALTYFDGLNWITIQEPSCSYAALHSIKCENKEVLKNIL